MYVLKKFTVDFCLEKISGYTYNISIIKIILKDFIKQNSIWYFSKKQLSQYIPDFHIKNMSFINTLAIFLFLMISFDICVEFY